MKAFSLWEPWATLTAIEAKEWETRHWFMQHRGPIAIHAAKKKFIPGNYSKVFLRWLDRVGVDVENLNYGCIVCTAIATECLPTRILVLEEQERVFGDFTPGRYALHLEKVLRLEKPIPAVGQQRFWDWTPSPAILKRYPTLVDRAS